MIRLHVNQCQEWREKIPSEPFTNFSTIIGLLS
ncbi:hypothetical protein SAMN05720354_10760 [Nitrosospira sp. Nsp1]|nr:hypothetical protein SAMN05720354_10760 [Nitrosospira sp. Nsp1]